MNTGIWCSTELLIFYIEVLSYVMVSEGQRGNIGKEFVLSSLVSTGFRKQDHYFLLTTPEEHVDVYVEVDLNHTDIQSNVFSVFGGSVANVSLLYDFGINGSAKRPIIYMNSTGEFGVTTFISAYESGASYLGLPINVLGKEYRFAPFCDTGLCSCALVTTQQYTTLRFFMENRHVHISYDIAFVEKISFVFRQYLELKTLSKHDHISIEGPKDFTGIYLHADAPVAVFCGCKRNAMINAIEELLPVEEFDTLFYPLPVVRSMPTSFVRIVVNYNCTKITIGRIKKQLDAGDYEDFSLLQIGSSKISADKPVSAIQIFHRHDDKTSNTESSMVLLPSKNQYSKHFIIPRNLKKQHRLYVGTLALLDFNIVLKGKPANQYGTFSKGVFIQADSDGAAVNLSCTHGQPFLSFVYRNRVSKRDNPKLDAYANPVGFNLTRHTETSNTDLHVPQCNVKTTTLSTKTSTMTATVAMTTTLPPTTMFKETTQSTTKSTSTEVPTRSSITVKTQPCCPCVGAFPSPPPLTQSTTIEANIDINRKIQKIQEELRVDRSELSSTIRRRTSAEDERLSAKGIGLVGMSIMCTMIGFFVMLDVPTIFHHFGHLWNNVFGRGLETCRRKILRA